VKVRALKTDFVSDGFTHHLVSRDGDIAIFSRSRNGREHFEVIKIKRRTPHPLDANLDAVDFVEHYAVTQNWGETAWTYKTLKEAIWKAAKMTAKGSC
jgi:hypothetical protein